MPELPDVENYTRRLERHAMRKAIAGVEVANRKVLDGVAPDGLSKRGGGKS
ncbi:MAG: DNA-formamidopyrimidine glycosylase family protein [Acetobacterales bacterium]